MERGTSDEVGYATGLWHMVQAGLRELFPGYFALIMATGIISLACGMLGLPILAQALFRLNIVNYAVIATLMLARLIGYPRLMLADLTDHARGPGFFTSIAGSCVLGTQFVVIGHENGVAWILWGVGVTLSFTVIYAFFAAVTLRGVKPDLETGINGAWLIATVGSQSIAILSTLLLPTAGAYKTALVTFALIMYLMGCMTYLTIIPLILYRFTFFRLTPAELTPPYWINMGAVAITTLAGATLIMNAGRSSLLTAILPFLKGLTLYFWATATWWIPLLLILGVWRHLYRHFPLRYSPQYWGMVFPLGMYTACTIRLSQAVDLPLLAPVTPYLLAIALFAWSLTFAGLIHELVRDFGRPRLPESPARPH